MQKLERRDFLKTGCRICLLGAATLTFGDLLSACGTPAKVFSTTMNNNQVNVPLSRFATDDTQIISVQHFEYEIAVRKKNDQYEALLMQCTHQNNQVVRTGSGFYCSLHGSQFDQDGNVKKGPAERPLPRLRTEIVQDHLVIYTNQKA